ncbi:MAG: glycosyltransferase family 39 protein [Ignavibacteriales bacterium]|nr:glycosyltransferase family 39 protein [Ignavibacteriales bacterium]
MINSKSKFDFKSSTAILIYLSLFKLFLLLIFAGNYGIFRDEYYYIECSKHLDWGYVDQPPFNAILLLISRTIFGESIFGIRIFAYLAGSLTVFLSGLIARELGGGKYAQFLSALAVVFSGVLLGGSSYYSMNAFDFLFASLMFYYLIRLIKTDNPKLWILIGLIFGIGLLNKLTFLFLGFGLFIGLLLTKNRKYFLNKELYIGAALALLIFLPNIIWQIKNNYPTLEFMHNAAMYKNASMSFFQFFSQHLLELNPFSTLLLAAAFYFLFVNKSGKMFAVIGLMYISILVVYVFNNGKPYYMGVLFPVILSAGAVGADLLIEKYLRNWARYTLVLLLLPGYVVTAPFAIPILDVDSYLKLSEATGIKPSLSERNRTSALPQFFADRFGWEEMVQKTAQVYNKLSDDEKKDVLIIAQNYGEAGSVNYYRNKYGLPKAVSPHNNYWIWGYPQNHNKEVTIVIGGDLEDNKEFFEEVEVAASHYNELGMPFENVDIYICRKPKMKLSEAWERIKFFI